MLHNMRFDLAGASYDDEEDDSGINGGSTMDAPSEEPSNCNDKG